MQGHAGPPPFVFKGGSTMVNRPIYNDVLKQYSISKGSTKRVMFSCQIDKIVNAPTGCYVSPQEEMVKTVKCDFDGDWLSRFGWLKCWSEGLLCYWNVGFGMDRANLWMHSGNWVKSFDQGDERLPILAPQDVCRVEGCTPCLYFMIQRGCAGSTCGWCHLRHDQRNESFGLFSLITLTSPKTLGSSGFDDFLGTHIGTPGSEGSQVWRPKRSRPRKATRETYKELIENALELEARSAIP